jgi:hypothetical protein
VVAVVMVVVVVAVMVVAVVTGMVAFRQGACWSARG